MSPLDQAIIKAYAKDKPPVAAPAAASPPVAVVRPWPTSDHAIEQVYHEGRLYRTSAPVTAERGSSVPPPHLGTLPPTSPRRTVRRSILRRLAAAEASGPPPASSPPPRIARKVIIRHVSHSVAPPPLGLSRTSGGAAALSKTTTPIDQPSPRTELAPETVAPAPAAPVPPAPVTPAAPPPAAPVSVPVPLNAAIAAPPTIQVHLPWENQAALGAAAIVVESRSAPADRPWQVVSVKLDALAELAQMAEARAAAPLAAQSPEKETVSEPPSSPPFSAGPSTSFSAKSLADREEPRVQMRWDAPHASGRQRPHVRFFPATTEPQPAQPPGPASPAVAPAALGDEIEQPMAHDAANQNAAEPASIQLAAAAPPVPAADRIAAAVLTEAAVPPIDELPIDAAPDEFTIHDSPPTTHYLPLAAEALSPLTVEELTFAEPFAEPIVEPPNPLADALASDLIPHERDEDWPLAAEAAALDPPPVDAPLVAAPSAEPLPAPPAERPVAPQWEVDAFQWPRTCQKLMTDEHGYLARAGEKLLAAVQDGLRVLAITGSRRGEGRTTLALCLARAAAAAGVQTAIMDCDFARPQLAGKIGLEVAYGWQDAAIGKIPLSEAAVKSVADNITVLPLESSAAVRSISLADPRVTATIRAAAATFELLILDMGPLAAGDALAFPPGEKCPLDAAIVVRDLRFATASESQAVGNRLHEAGLDAVGIAENFVIEEETPVTSV